MTQQELLVPDIGDFHNVAVIEVLVRQGEFVESGQNLIVVETDKATLEIPAGHAGTIREMKIAVGDRVSCGTSIAIIEAGEAEARDAVEPHASEPVVTSTSQEHVEVPAPAPAPAPVRIGEPPIADSTPSLSTAHASPSVRKLARQLGVSLDRVRPTGPRQRITADDVHRHVKGVTQEAQERSVRASASDPTITGLPSVDFAMFGAIERRDLSRIRKLSGAKLHRNWISIPHVTNHEEADITDLEAFRLRLNREHEKAGLKVTPLALLIKACVSTLKAFPEFNASLDGDQLIVKRYFHIGFAADTPNGLVVPVLRDADQKGLLDIARETSTLARKARDGTLTMADMSGGSFSISSLGGVGGTYFTPIINAPEVAILGVGRSQTRVSWIEAQATPRVILPLSLSWDHRAVDGAAAGRFNAHLAEVLGDFRRALL